jgi:GDPmannose 4,6-dehydratase
MRHKFLISLIIILVPALINGSPKKALVFGVAGQDGTYLTEFLLHKGYIVHGVINKHLGSTQTIKKEFPNNFFIHRHNLSDTDELSTLLEKVDPDEIYNLSSQSQVQKSFKSPLYTTEVNALGTLKILEAIRQIDKENKMRFYQASSSEMFGKVREIPQTELTPFFPQSPYGIAKLYAYWITNNYRNAYGMFACNGILFNHESPLRDETFVTRKISQAVARIYKGEDIILYLGNLDAKRDWGYAKDYVEAMWLILQQNAPDDYIIATGEIHSIREFAELAFKEIGITIDWKGSGQDEIGVNRSTGKTLVKVDPQYFRPVEVNATVGNATKAKEILKWEPATSFQELIKIMVQNDIRRLQ